MDTIKALDRRNKAIKRLLKEKKELCEELAEKVNSEYKERITSWNQVGDTEPSVYEDYENPLYKRAQVWVILSEEHYMDRLGYVPTEKTWSNERHDEIYSIEQEVYELLKPLEEEIKEKYDESNSWVRFRTKDPMDKLA